MKVPRSTLVLALAGLALLTLVVLATPPASAQTPQHGVSVSYTLPSEVQPGTTATVTVNVTYRWDDGAQIVAQGETTVTLNSTVSFAPLVGAPWASLSLNPETLTFTPGLQAGQEVQTSELNIVVAQDAPAFLQAPITVRAVAEQNGQMQAQSADQSAGLYAAFAPSVAVQDRGAIELSGSGTVRVPVENRGNGPVRVWIKSVQAPDGMTATPAGDAVVLGLSGALRDAVAPHAEAKHLSVDAALQDDMVAPSTGELLVEVEGSGTGPLVLDLAYGPSQEEGVETASTQAQLQVSSAGLPIVPILLLVLVAAAAGGGYVVLKKRREADEEDGEAAPGGAEGGEPVLVPIDEEGGEEAWTEDAEFEAAQDVEELEGEEWVEVDEEGGEGAAEGEGGEEPEAAEPEAADASAGDEDEWVFDDDEEE